MTLKTIVQVLGKKNDSGILLMKISELKSIIKPFFEEINEFFLLLLRNLFLLFLKKESSFIKFYGFLRLFNVF